MKLLSSLFFLHYSEHVYVFKVTKHSNFRYWTVNRVEYTELTGEIKYNYTSHPLMTIKNLPSGYKVSIYNSYNSL